ncbi:hypothetical protein RFI_37792 [Reticulomyxa filosa]|uniref:Uncharacterized protein n=1 Tax=Reticulomyxa filosa TaxID=46433 RepID=X6LCB8_RETFI|nr:hypothetical protein RFI_37792 [Reticulomyxa filosa]|eukprot:ETN99677.1 hypothetical protein RFI_37792 [Reticulomyxa filosa]
MSLLKKKKLFERMSEHILIYFRFCKVLMLNNFVSAFVGKKNSFYLVKIIETNAKYSNIMHSKKACYLINKQAYNFKYGGGWTEQISQSINNITFF